MMGFFWNDVSFPLLLMVLFITAVLLHFRRAKTEILVIGLALGLLGLVVSR